MDGQYGDAVLDQKSGKTLESFRSKLSQEGGGYRRRDRDCLEVLQATRWRREGGLQVPNGY